MSNDGITELWDWIPHWILSALNFFQGYPDGHQGDLFDLGDDWNWSGDALKDLEQLLEDVTDETYKWYEDGEGAEQIKKEFDSLFTGPTSVDETAKGLHDLGKYTRHGGTEIEFTKMMSAVFAGITTRAVIALIPQWPWGDALIPVVIGIGRAVLGAFSREALGKLAAAAAETTLKNILENYVKKIAIRTLTELATKQGLEQVGLAAGKAGLQGAAIDAGLQGLQIAMGHRDDGFDLKQTLRTGLEWGAGGLLGAPVGMAVGHAMAKAALSDAVRAMGHDNPWARGLLRPEVRSMTSGVFGGALGGSVGMYGAGIAWQLGEHLANPHDPNYQGIDWTYHPGLIAAGAGMGALHGVKGGSEQRIQVLAASENVAAARADGSAVRPAPPMVEATARLESANVVDRIGKGVDTAATPEQREHQVQAYRTAKEIYGTENIGDRPVSEMQRLSALQRLEASTSPTATNAAGGSASGTGAGHAGAAATAANSSGASPTGTAEPRTATGTSERGAGSPERAGVRPPVMSERGTSRAGVVGSENRDHAANLDAGKQESAPMTREEVRASAAEAREEVRATGAEAREDIRTSTAETRAEIRASAADLREEIRDTVGEAREEQRADNESASEPKQSRTDGGTEHGREFRPEPEQPASAPESGRGESGPEQRGAVGESESSRSAGQSGRAEGDSGPRTHTAEAKSADPGATIAEPRAAAAERTGRAETESPGVERRSDDVGGGRAKDPTGYRLDQSDRELPREDRGTAAAVGEFRGDARPAEAAPLTRDELVNAIRDNLGLITPEEVAWNRDGQHFVLPGGREIHLGVGETHAGAVAEFRARPDASGYDVTVSPRARSQDVARAVAHELAEIRLAQDPVVRTDPISEHPAELTSHLGGRFAELTVLAAHIDRATFDPARAHELPGLRQDMADLLAHLGLRDGAVSEGIAARSPHPDSSDPWVLLAAHDPVLAHRLALGFGADGLLSQRPVFNRDLTAPVFEEASAAHLDRMADALTGNFAADVVRAESMALHGRMREELARRIFDPIFTDPGAGEARRTVRTGQLLRALDPINEAINRPGLHGAERAEAVHRAIDGFRDAMPEEFRNAVGPAGFERMQRAADGLSGADHISGVLDHGRGELSMGTERISLSDFLHSIDRANRGAAEHGVNLEYTVVVHNPVEGRSVVVVLSRPQPQHRLPLEQNRFGEDNYRIPLQPRPAAPAAQQGGHTIDVGVGRSAFAVEMTPPVDRAGGGLIIKTELADDFAVAGQRRRNLGILDPGPLTEPGTVTVFGDLLFHGDALGDGGNGAVARIFVNNVSAHFGPEVYDALAGRLPQVLAAGGRIELQWDMKPEKAVDLGGKPGDRGHIRGDQLWDAIQRRPDLASRFRVDEYTEFPHPGNENYDYTIDAGASNKLDANKMAQFVPPRPDHRMVIVYEPHRAPEGEHGTASAIGEFRGDARPEGKLEQNHLLNEVRNNLGSITPDGMVWNPDREHFVLPTGTEIHLETVPPPRDGTVAEFHRQPDGSYRVEVSSGARAQDVARAVAHELAEIQLAERPSVVTDPLSERPSTLTSHLGGRFAELKVLVAHIDRSSFDPVRARDLPGLRKDLTDLLDHIGVRPRPLAEVGAAQHDSWTLLTEHDRLLARRLELGLGDEGLLSDRPVFGKDLTNEAFEAAKTEHAARLNLQLTGDHIADVVRAESMALNGRMRQEQSLRIFDPIFEGERSKIARASMPTKELLPALDPINAAINHPGLDGPARKSALQHAIAGLPEPLRAALGPTELARMKQAAAELASTPERVTGVLDHGSGEVRTGELRISTHDFLVGLDRANRGATEHGMNVEYVLVMHAPVDGHSMVEVLERPRPQHRLPLGRNVFGAENEAMPLRPRPSVPVALDGADTIDVGVGRSAFGVEMTPVADRSHGGLVVKTEMLDNFVIAGQRRRGLGVFDPGPLTEPGTVLVFGDLLTHGSVLGDGETGAIARIFVNNVSAEYEAADYHALADRLSTMLAPGGRIEVQWDMKPQSPGSPDAEAGDRNHIRGDFLLRALADLQPGRGADFRVIEYTEFPPPGNTDYDYSVDASSKSQVDRRALSIYTSPRPDHRMVIAYEPHGHVTVPTDPATVEDENGTNARVDRRLLDEGNQ